MKETRLAHLPALDGLRGLAVLGVLFFHDGRLTGGYLGVDLFFVLSGFLITSLLLKEHAATGAIDLRAFWIRRARRLFPALVALLAFVAVYAAVIAEKTELSRIRGDGLATLAYVANWRAIFSARSYWEMFLAPSPLEHTWSLAIEEQFYVVWPLVAWAVLRRFRKGAAVLLAISLVLAAGSMFSMFVRFDPTATDRAYLGTDTRGAAILAGGALACVFQRMGAIERRGALLALDVAGAAAIVGLGFAWRRLDGTAPFLYRGGFWLTELAVAILIACAAHGSRSLVARLFAFRPLAWVGLVSYGVYLWHWPIYCLVSTERVHVEGWRLTLARLAITFAVSLASFWVLEQPIRRRGLPFGRPWVVVPGAFAAVAAGLICCTRGAVAVPEVTPLEAPVAAEPPPAPSNAAGTPPRDRHVLPARAETKPGELRVLVVGDSVATALGERLYFVEDRKGALVAERGIGDCSILEGKIPTKSLTNVPHKGGNCSAHWNEDVAELQPDVTLVVLGGGFFAPVRIDGQWQRVCDAPARKAYVDELVSRLQSLGASAGHIVVTHVPNPVGHWRRAEWDRQVVCFNEAMNDVVKRVPSATALELGEHLCPGAHCILEDQGAPIRPDGMHFGGLGAENTAEWVLDRLRGTSGIAMPSPSAGRPDEKSPASG